MRVTNLLLGLLASTAAGVGFAGAASAKTLNAVASFTVLADVVKQIGGDHINVKSLVPPDGDPHEFEPSPNDAKSLKEADITFLSGEGLETWFEKLVTASGYSGTPYVVSKGIKTRKMEEDGKTVTDPHVWNSPVNVKIWVGNIEKALAAADPADAADFKANATKYSKELDDLNTYAKSVLETVPKDRRKILTSHDAFGYFGREYGVQFLFTCRAFDGNRSIGRRRCQVDRSNQDGEGEDVLLRKLQRLAARRANRESNRRAAGWRALRRIAVEGGWPGTDLHQDVPLQCRADLESVRWNLIRAAHFTKQFRGESHGARRDCV